MAGLAIAFTVTGACGVFLISRYEQVLRLVVSGTSLDLLHFSLHPVSATRLAIAFGLVLLHASVMWSVVAVIRLPSLLRRMPRIWLPQAVATAAWLGGVSLVTAIEQRRDPAVPIAPLLVAVGVAGACAIVVARLRGRARRASQAARLGALFLALLVPAVAMYPSLLAFATAAKEQLVATEYGPAGRQPARGSPDAAR